MIAMSPRLEDYKVITALLAIRKFMGDIQEKISPM
jgi:hypothetical protein